MVKIYVPDTRRARSLPGGGGGGGIPRLAKEKAAAEAMIAEIQGELAMLKMQRQNMLGGAALPAGFGANAAARLAAAQTAAQQSNYRIVSASGLPVSMVSPALVASSGISPSAVAAVSGARQMSAAQNDRAMNNNSGGSRSGSGFGGSGSGSGSGFGGGGGNSNARQSASDAREAASAQRQQNAEARQAASAQRQQNAEERKSAATNARSQQQQERASANAEARSQAAQQAGEAAQQQRQQQMELQSQREQAKIQQQQEAQSAAMQSRQTQQNMQSQVMQARMQTQQEAQSAAIQGKQSAREAAMQRQSTQQNMQSQAMQARMQTQQEAQSGAIQARQSMQQQMMEQQSARVQAAVEAQSSQRSMQQQIQQNAASATIQARQEAMSGAQRAKNNIRNAAIQRRSAARDAEQERKNEQRDAVTAQKVKNAELRAEMERNKKSLTHSTKMRAEVERLTGSKKPNANNGSNGSNNGSNHGGLPHVGPGSGRLPHVGPGGLPHVGNHGGLPHVGPGSGRLPHVGPGGLPHVGNHGGLPHVGPGNHGPGSHANGKPHGPIPSWVVNSSPVSWRTVLQIPAGTTPTASQIKQRAASMVQRGRAIGDRKIRNIYVQRVQIAERQALRDLGTFDDRKEWRRILRVSGSNRTIENFQKRYAEARARATDPAAKNRVERAWATVKNLVARKQLTPAAASKGRPPNRVPFAGNEPLTHETQQRLHDAMAKGVPGTVIRSIIAGNATTRTRGGGGGGTKRLPVALQQQLRNHAGSPNELIAILKRAGVGGASRGPSKNRTPKPGGPVAGPGSNSKSGPRGPGSGPRGTGANIRPGSGAPPGAPPAANRASQQRKEAAAIANVEAARRSPSLSQTTKSRLAAAERKLAHDPARLEEAKKVIIRGNAVMRARANNRGGKLWNAERIRARAQGREPRPVDMKADKQRRIAAMQAMQKRGSPQPYQQKKENREAAAVIAKAQEARKARNRNAKIANLQRRVAERQARERMQRGAAGFLRMRQRSQSRPAARSGLFGRLLG